MEQSQIAVRPRSPRPLRQPVHPDISEQMIERLVRHFYGRVRADAVLAPLFGRVVGDWEPHLQTMMAFWSSVMMMSGRYKGQPVPKHKALSQVAPTRL
ncbi:MAG: group III truncated hemoglobin [Alphaproteobacteria bacterium]|jgi:hemoglobin